MNLVFKSLKRSFSWSFLNFYNKQWNVFLIMETWYSLFLLNVKEEEIGCYNICNAYWKKGEFLDGEGC